MSDAETLNDALSRAHPAAARALSPLGRAAVFPRGIPFQAAEARNSKINATIGQLTDGRGQPIPLPSLQASLEGLDPRASFLYAPVDGPVPLRTAWVARERRLAGDPAVATTLPVVTHGLTHGLSLIASLFADPETDVLLPGPGWENYDLVFRMTTGARIVRYELFRDGRFDPGGLARALEGVRTKAVLVLNFPSNPLGWTPNEAEARQVVELVASHRGPLVAVTDDAYQGWVYEPGCQVRSLFWDLAQAADPERLLVVKTDGATKELVFFSSRVGFLTFAAPPEAEAALTSKLKYLIRGSVGCASGPAMAMVHRALADEGLEAAVAERLALLADRYRTLRGALEGVDSPRVRVLPFNSAFFVFLQLSGGLEAEPLRKKLLAEHSLGTIAYPDDNALRIAYCSIGADRLPELVESLFAAVS
jgi:aspartate/methionine/tyrosine aminotransferase